MIWIPLQMAWQGMRRHACWMASTSAGMAGISLLEKIHNESVPMRLMVAGAIGMTVIMGTVLDNCRILLANWPAQDLEEIVRG